MSSKNNCLEIVSVLIIEKPLKSNRLISYVIYVIIQIWDMVVIEFMEATEVVYEIKR